MVRVAFGPVVVALLVAATLLLGNRTAYADGFRCGVRLIDLGMQMVEVRDACGNPVQVTHSFTQRQSLVWLHGRSYFGDGFVDVPVETWVYNFGSLRLMQQLRFEDGVLAEIVPLDYGYQGREP